MEKKYWQSFSELNENDHFQKQNSNEFREELPFEDIDGKGWLDAKAPRRDFLKYLGFSTAAATLASCKVPVRKAIPFANKPENIVPGMAKYYATTYVQDGDVLPILAKVREGRPIKIEGNTLCSYTQGGTSPRAQASVLDLYDTFRLTHPQRRSGATFQEIPTYDQADQLVGNALAGLGGAPVVLLTSTIVSPSAKQIIFRNDVYLLIYYAQYDTKGEKAANYQKAIAIADEMMSLYPDPNSEENKYAAGIKGQLQSALDKYNKSKNSNSSGGGGKGKK